MEDERKLSELLESYNKIFEALDSCIEKKSVFDKASQLISSGEIMPHIVKSYNHFLL